LGKTTFILLILIFCTVLKAQTVGYNQEFQVNTFISSYQWRPSVCGLVNGGFVICWESNGQDGDLNGIYGQIYDATGTKVGQEFRANTYIISDQEFPSVCGLTGGGFVICWESWDQDGEWSGVFGQVYDSIGRKRGEEFQINTYTSMNQFSPVVADLSDGGFVVCWVSENQDGDSFGVFGQMYTSEGIRYGSEFQINTYIPGYQWNLSVAGISNGGFVVIWASEDQDGDGWGVFGQLYDNGGIKHGQEFRVNTYTFNHQWQPSVCGLSDSVFAVCWESLDQDSDGWDIFGQLYNNGGTKHDQEFQINTYTDNYQTNPGICGLSDGGFVVSWVSEDQDGDGTGIFGQMYDDSGKKYGEEFKINSFTNLGQFEPAICALSDDGFVVCWQSDGQDGDNYGIYGKYYLTSPIVHQLQLFSIISPFYDATLYSTTVNFQWEQGSSIHLNFPWELEYSVYLDHTDTFNDPQVFTDIYDTTFSVDGLTPGQTYFWKVSAKNIEGDSLWSSETFGFYINPAADIQDDLILKPETFNLYQNYPNPFNPITMINYQLPITNYVELSIYNHLGQKVVTLIDEQQNAGYHQVQWDASGFASGIYYYRIEAGKFKASQKMLLVK
jgi:hypothetical protein